MAAFTIWSDSGALKNKVSHCFHSFPIYLPWSEGLDAMILVFWMLSFKPTFSLSFFTFIKRLFSSSSLSAIRVVSSAYLRLLISLPAILISACTSSSPAFLMMYSACKLNRQGNNIQPWRTPFPIWNQSVAPCPVLTVASWPAYRFLKRQVRCSGIPISFRIFHSLLWSSQSKALASVDKLALKLTWNCKGPRGARAKPGDPQFQGRPSGRCSADTQTSAQLSPEMSPRACGPSIYRKGVQTILGAGFQPIVRGQLHLH